LWRLDDTWYMDAGMFCIGSIYCMYFEDCENGQCDGGQCVGWWQACIRREMCGAISNCYNGGWCV